MTRFSTSHPLLACLLAAALGGCVILDEGNSDSGAGTGNGDGNGDGNNGSADDTGGNDGGGPSADLIEDCEKSCADLLFFECLTADTHEICYSTCNEKNAIALETFSACVDNTLPVCGNAGPCYDNLVDADPVGGTGDQGTCADACAEWLEAGCEAFTEAPSCEAFCDGLSDTLQQAVVECVDSRDGCMLPPECDFEGGGEGGVEGD